jgi:hypothetical protein
MTSIVIGVALNTFVWRTDLVGFSTCLAVCCCLLFLLLNIMWSPPRITEPLATVGSLRFLCALSAAGGGCFLSRNPFIYSPALAWHWCNDGHIPGSVFTLGAMAYALGVCGHSLIIAEIVVGFNYLPLIPDAIGLAAGWFAYALTSIVTAFKNHAGPGLLG